MTIGVTGGVQDHRRLILNGSMRIVRDLPRRYSGQPRQHTHHQIIVTTNFPVVWNVKRLTWPMRIVSDLDLPRRYTSQNRRHTHNHSIFTTNFTTNRCHLNIHLCQLRLLPHLHQSHQIRCRCPTFWIRNCLHCRHQPSRHKFISQRCCYLGQCQHARVM